MRGATPKRSRRPRVRTMPLSSPMSACQSAVRAFPRSLQHGPESGVVHIGAVAVQQDRQRPDFPCRCPRSMIRSVTKCLYSTERAIADQHSQQENPDRPVLHYYDVSVIKGVSALRAELGGMLGIGRLPAAFVALVLGYAGRLLRAALGAELALVHRTAGTGPAVRCRSGSGTAALRAELSCDGGAAGCISSCLR